MSAKTRLIIIFLLSVSVLYIRFKLLHNDMSLITYSINIFILITCILLSYIKFSHKIVIIFIILFLYRKTIYLLFSVIKIIHTYAYKIPNTIRNDNKQLCSDVTMIYSKYFKLVTNFDKLPTYPTIYVCNYIHDRLENMSCMLIPQNISVIMIGEIAKYCLFDKVLKHLIIRKKNGNDFDHIEKSVKETIDKGISVFAYVSTRTNFIGKIGRVRTGMFKIAHKYNIPITPISIDYIHYDYGMIPYQRYEVRVGDSFLVDNTSTNPFKVRSFFKKSYMDFKRRKFLV